MKKLTLIFGALLGMLGVGYAQTVARSVMVNTSGVVVSPTNFWANAPISTNAGATNAVLTNTNGVMLGVFGSGALTNPSIKIAATNTGFMHTIGPDRIIVVVGGVSALQIFSNTVSASAFTGTFNGSFAVGSGSAITFNGGANIAGTRTNLGLGLAALTNTNALNFRNAIGAGDVFHGGEPFFASVEAETLNTANLYDRTSGLVQIDMNNGLLEKSGRSLLEWGGSTDHLQINVPFSFLVSTNNWIKTNAPTVTNNVNRWIEVKVGTNSYRIPLYQ